MTHRPRASFERGGVWLVLVLVLLALFVPRVSSASQTVIPPGREGHVHALLRPHALGDAITPGWTLHSFRIDAATIHLWVAGPEEAFAHVTLDHFDERPWGSRRLPSFALTVVARPPGSEAAVDELCRAIARNDDGSFWRTTGVRASSESSSRPFEPRLDRLVPWARDGIVLVIAFTVLVLGLARRTLRGAPWWMTWSLLAIVLVGAILRLTLSPGVGMEAWPYTRYMLPARLVFEGPLLASLTSNPVWASETLLTTTLVLAILGPLAVYVHARYLLDDHRAALLAAGMLAVLPMHLRFSQTDVAFIPSITISSILFALVHVATREPSKRLGWFAVAIVGVPLAAVYLVRPLNIMYFGLLIATALVDRGLYGRKHGVDKTRTWAVFGIVTAVTAFGGVPWLLESFGRQVSEGLSVDTLRSAMRVLWNPEKNALLHPGFTPPGLLVLAVLGGVDLWRRNRRPLLWYLVLWLFGLLIAHAYVVPTSSYMQARYHLHLIVPFVMLAACGLEAVLRWMAAARGHAALAGRRYPAAIALLVAYVAVSPFVHLSFVRETGFNEMHEWSFVHGLREQIPTGCEVVEYVGDTADPRMQRVGSYMREGTPRSLWRTHEVARVAEGEPVLPDEVRALLEDPPQCLVYYEGLPCFGSKDPDEDKAAACRAIESLVALEMVTSTQFDSRVYDESVGKGLGSIDRIELTLYRAHRKPP